MEYVKNFKELEVYKLSQRLAREIFQVSRSFPKEELYSLTDQIRRASRSVGGQIAEAWGKRRYEKHFVSKLTDADGEQLETQHWIGTALDCGYLLPEQANEVEELCGSIGKMISNMIKKAPSFCKW